jgi:hypothetical protein
VTLGYANIQSPNQPHFSLTHLCLIDVIYIYQEFSASSCSTIPPYQPLPAAVVTAGFAINLAQADAAFQVII